MSSPSTMTRRRSTKRKRRMSAPPIFAASTGRQSLRSILTPGVPLTHPDPHWSAKLAQCGQRRDHRRCRTVLPRAAGACAGRAVRRHYRHQRQIHHHGADRAYPARSRPRRADGRQYRRAGAAARAADQCAPLRHRMLVLPDRSGALDRSDHRHHAQRHAGSYRPARHHRELRGGEEPHSRPGQHAHRRRR